MRIGVIGINHKQANLQLREILAKICKKRFGPNASIHGKHAFILLSTCNRTELYFNSDDLSDSHSYALNILKNEIPFNFEQKLYSFFAKECFYHLVSVAVGFDSAIIAETEIQRQVKDAYEMAAQDSQLPACLHYTFQKALKIAKQIRATYSLGKGMPDVEHAIYQAGLHYLSKPQEKSILFVGASTINQKVIEYLIKKECKNIHICNRTLEKAKRISLKFNLSILDWNHPHDWGLFDWIIFGTKSSEYLLSSPFQIKKERLIMDLACPRNVDPKLSSHFKLLNIDQINLMLEFRKKMIATSITTAQQEMIQAVDAYTHRYQIKTNRFTEVSLCHFA